jgi:hypothetical protein
MMELALLSGRRLDKENAHPGSIGADFGRFGVDLWGATYRLDKRNRQRRIRLEQINTWRNAIVHQDFQRLAAHQVNSSITADLTTFRIWWAALNQLAAEFDRVMLTVLGQITGHQLWPGGVEDAYH